MGALLPTAASANQRPPTLAGRAVLPAEALAAGPASGAAVRHSRPFNGIQFPRPSQPVLGFSAVIAGDRPGSYLAMPDNGYGSKANSRRLPPPRLQGHARLQDREGRLRRRPGRQLHLVPGPEPQADRSRS